MLKTAASTGSRFCTPLLNKQATFIKVIDTAETGVVQTLGRFTRLMKPGFNIYFPFIQKITVVDNRTQQETFHFKGKTRDNAFVTLTVGVQYQIKQEDSGNSIFKLDNPLEQMHAQMGHLVRSKLTALDLDSLFESQDDIGSAVENMLVKQMKEYGFTIHRTLVTDIVPSQKVEEAMNKINASEREKVVAANLADAKYITQVREAEADAKRKQLQGAGTRLQRDEILQGYEQGVVSMATGLGVSPEQLLKFVVRVQELDTLAEVSKSQNTKVLLFPWQKDEGGDSTLERKIQESMIKAMESI